MGPGGGMGDLGGAQRGDLRRLLEVKMRLVYVKMRIKMWWWDLVAEARLLLRQLRRKIGL